MRDKVEAIREAFNRGRMADFDDGDQGRDCPHCGAEGPVVGRCCRLDQHCPDEPHRCHACGPGERQ